jgi:hypothetical protein
MIPQRLAVMVRVMRSSSWQSGVANSAGLCSTRVGVGVAVDAGVHGVAGCGGGGEDPLQPRSWLESVALRLVEARGLR